TQHDRGARDATRAPPATHRHRPPPPHRRNLRRESRYRHRQYPQPPRHPLRCCSRLALRTTSRRRIFHGNEPAVESPVAPAVRVLIADDEVPARNRLKHLLTADSAVEVVGEAASAATAIELALDLRPDVLFLDIE